MSRNSGSLNHLQPEGLVQACNGTALVFKMDDTFNLIQLQVPFALEDSFLMPKRKVHRTGSGGKLNIS
jgi:hypothetical protein